MERSEGKQIGEGERVPTQSPHLREPKVTSGSANGAWRPCVHSVLEILPLSIALNEEMEKRDKMEPEKILMWWVKYVDTARPRRVRCLDAEWMHLSFHSWISSN
jgi:hypothetical protein